MKGIRYLFMTLNLTSLNNDTLLSEEIDLRQISPLTLSFIGDSVYDLMIREYIISLGNRPVGQLNNKKVIVVNCKFQAECFSILEPYLTQEELTVYKRGRNAEVHSTPKHADKLDYHKATGIEALFGYLYLKKDIFRLRELFRIIQSKINENI